MALAQSIQCICPLHVLQTPMPKILCQNLPLGPKRTFLPEGILVYLPRMLYNVLALNPVQPF